MVNALLMVSMFVIAVFLILLVLVQRGRGGGLTGALGGMGGQSAFGTKAGDLFTRITIGAAAAWILLCVLSVTYYNRADSFSSSFGSTAVPPAGQTAPGGALPGGTVPGGAGPILPAAPTGGALPKETSAPKGADSGAPAAPAPQTPEKK